MVYRYEWYDYTSAALRKHNLDPAARVRNTDIQVDPDEVIMISKDTAYITEEGEIVNETITRRLSGPWDFLHTRIVNIYPDESCWVNDFNNAYNEPYMRMYFSHPGYDDYPVVGVSWEQATAFCVWRTNLFKESLNFPSGQALEPFRLPTEGEWEYAARTGKNETISVGRRRAGERKRLLLGQLQTGQRQLYGRRPSDHFACRLFRSERIRPL